MKKHTHIKLLLIAFFITACQTDDPDINSINGSWKTSNVNVDVKVNRNLMSIWLIFEGGYSTADALNLEKSFSTTYKNEFKDSFLSLNSDNSFELLKSTNEIEKGSFRINSDTSEIILNEGSNNEMIFTINKFESNKLNLTVLFEEIDDLDKDGNNEIIEIYTTLQYIK